MAKLKTYTGPVDFWKGGKIFAENADQIITIKSPYYTVIIPESAGHERVTIRITKKGADFLFGTYKKVYPYTQETVETLQDRQGYIATTSEMIAWKKQGYLHPEFALIDYLLP